jgi:hypothetical protein
MNQTYYYVDGVCGSGKTYTAIKKIAALVQAGKTTIYATETIKLLKQTKDGLEALGIECCLINSKEKVGWKMHYHELVQEIQSALNLDTDPTAKTTKICKSHLRNYAFLEHDEQLDWRSEFRSVVQDIKDTIEQTTTSSPRVILCTTKSLIRAASLISDGIKLPLYIDEGFIVADSGEYISATDGEIHGIAAKLKLSEKAPDDLSTDNRYQLPDKLLSLEKYVKSELYDVEYDTSKAKLSWVAYLDIKSLASHFSEITLLAACHEDTLQYFAIEASGCKQVKLDWGLATQHHTNGSIYVYWVLDKQKWRTTFRNRLSPQQMENIGRSFEQCHFSNESLSVKGITGYGKLLPVKSHGFNDASNNDHFLNLHAQMPSPYFNTSLKSQYRLNNEQIRKAYYQYDCYQAAMRVSLRNSTKSNPSKDDNYFCFGDKATAQYFISKLSPNVKLHQSKLVVRTAEEDTDEWIIEDLDLKRDRVDKVSENKAEQKRRRPDKEKLLAINPNLSKLKEAQNYIRDWRRINTGKRMTPKLYQQVANDFA